jgi:hypothetical protein
MLNRKLEATSDSQPSAGRFTINYFDNDATNTRENENRKKLLLD